MKKTQFKDTDKLMLSMCGYALDVAKEFGIELDYSDASIKKVEKILGILHREYKETRDESGLRGLALFFAAYIGEVIKKKGLGGKWKRNHPEVGRESFPFFWRDGVLFLYGWCLKRIIDGPQDNVWIKYQSLVLNDLKEKT